MKKQKVQTKFFPDPNQNCNECPYCDEDGNCESQEFLDKCIEKFTKP